MATQSWNQLKPLNLVTMATNKIYKGHFFYTYKEGGNNNNNFGQSFRTTVVSMKIKSYNQLNFLNLVTMATEKII